MDNRKTHNPVLKISFAAAALGAAAVYFGAVKSFHLPQRKRAGTIRVACVGDSITYGCLVPGQPWNSYPRQLGRMLGKGYSVGNFGYSDRAAIFDADYPYAAEKLYADSKNYRPDLVLLMLGTNDTKPHNWDPKAFERDMGRLIDSYREPECGPEVCLLLPPPLFPVCGKVLWGLRSNVLEEEVIPLLKKISEEKDVPLIDVHGAFEGKKELFADGCHPNAKGAKLLAQTVFEALAQMLPLNDKKQ